MDKVSAILDALVNFFNRFFEFIGFAMEKFGITLGDETTTAAE